MSTRQIRDPYGPTFASPPDWEVRISPDLTVVAPRGPLNIQFVGAALTPLVIGAAGSFLMQRYGVGHGKLSPWFPVAAMSVLSVLLVVVISSIWMRERGRGEWMIADPSGIRFPRLSVTIPRTAITRLRILKDVPTIRPRVWVGGSTGLTFATSATLACIYRDEGGSEVEYPMIGDMGGWHVARAATRLATALGVPCTETVRSVEVGAATPPDS